MANTFLTDSVIALEALSILENQLVLGKMVDRTKEQLFDRAKGGSNRGQTVNVRLPNAGTVRIGATFAAQDVTDQFVPFAINQQIGYDVALTSAEMSQNLSDFSAQIIKPAVAVIANYIDAKIADEYKNVANHAGTPGSPANTLATYLTAGVLLDQAACPRDGQRFMVTGPQGQADIVDALKGLFNKPGTIGAQTVSGEMDEIAGFRWGMDQNVKVHTIGPLGGAPVVNGANQVGASLVTNGWTAAAANRLKAGDVFTLAGVYKVNFLSKVSTGALQQFVVTADTSSDGAGNATIPISPSIVVTGPYQNVSNSPANTTALTLFGAANTQTGQALGGHKGAVTLGFCELPKPQGVDMAATKTDKQLGVSIRFIRWYDGGPDQFKARFDVLFGVKTLRPEWMVRVSGAAA